MEAFFAGLIGFLIGRGIPRKDAESIVKALEKYLGFEPPLGLTGYALKDMAKGDKVNAGVVVRGKAYAATAVGDIRKHEEIAVLGKSGDYLEVGSSLEAVARYPWYLEALNQLLGFDNTAVVTASDDWDLVKTIVMENFENKVMNKITYTYRVDAGIGYLKVTATIDAGAETTIHQTPAFANTDWKEKTASISPVLEDSKVTIKVYLKSFTSGQSTRNEKFECYGDVMQRFVYHD